MPNTILKLPNPTLLLGEYDDGELMLDESVLHQAHAAFAYERSCPACGRAMRTEKLRDGWACVCGHADREKIYTRLIPRMELSHG